MILMNDFGAEPMELREAVLAAVSRVVASGWYVLGQEVDRFEQEWAARCGSAHAVGVGNGMDAIEIGLRAMGIGPGDEVVTTPMTAFATTLAILRAGATPVLADIDPHTALLDPESVARCVGPRTRAVLLVHLYGRCADLDAWEAFCTSRGLELIEDCAQAHSARWKGRSAGSVGRFGAWSFYPTKNLGALGDGGMLTTCDADLAARAASLRNYGQSVRYEHPLVGMNSRLDEIQAAVLSAKLGWLDQMTERRRRIARRYRIGIRNPHVRMLPASADEAGDVHHLFVVTSPHRDVLHAHLAASGVQSHIHYPVPVHQQPPCKELSRDPTGLEASERHASSCLSLPCHPYLTDEAVGRVVEAVNAFRAQESAGQRIQECVA